MPETKTALQEVQTLEHFDAMVEAYKAQSPAKYAAKLKNGEFERARRKFLPPEPPKAPVSAKSKADLEKAEAEAKAKAEAEAEAKEKEEEEAKKKASAQGNK